MKLVETNEKNEVICDSSMVARKFGVKHADVTNKMRTLSAKLDDFRVEGFYPKFEFEDRIYRGIEYRAILMNRDCFMLLGLRFDTKRARRWQGQFIAAFNAMEQRLLLADANAADPAFLKIRNQGKIARLQETDIIKDFVEYATNQGSKSAKFYYKHITNSCYKALGLLVQRKPKLRDTMNIMELAELQLMEYRAGLLLRKYMKLERNYKDIYNSVKDDLLNYGSVLRIE